MLEISVFLCGALVMILEMVGARVLAPHVGTSAIVWTSLIGVVLACLALGAWAGGKFADKKLSIRGLAMTMLAAGLGCALTAFCNQGIGSLITSKISNLYIAAVAAAICIFALPAFFFGMITPYVVRLRMASIDTAGATVGRLYALSTAGSILGTFLGGFILISWLASSTILWGVACSMLLLSLANFSLKPLPRIALLALFVFLAWQDHVYEERLVANGSPMIIETPYNTIRIMEGEDRARGNAKVRLLATDPGYTQSGMLIDDPDELYFNYTRYYALGPKFVPNAKSVLMLGGGGYSVPKWLLSSKSGMPDSLQVNVVELDPVMTALASKIFALPNDRRLSIHHEDARSFLNTQTKQYDLVFVDVFNSHYSIPFHMGTLEAAKAMRRAVAPGGALLMNIISAVEGEDGRVFQSIWQALDKEFAETRIYCVGNPLRPDQVQNLMVVAFADKPDPAVTGTSWRAVSPDAREVEAMETRLYTKPVEVLVPPLEDDFAPVERYALMLTRQK